MIRLLRIAHSSFCRNIYSSSDNPLMDCDHCCQELIQLRDVALSITQTTTQVDKNLVKKLRWPGIRRAWNDALFSSEWTAASTAFYFIKAIMELVLRVIRFEVIWVQLLSNHGAWLISLYWDPHIHPVKKMVYIDL